MKARCTKCRKIVKGDVYCDRNDLKAKFIPYEKHQHDGPFELLPVKLEYGTPDDVCDRCGNQKEARIDNAGSGLCMKCLKRAQMREEMPNKIKPITQEPEQIKDILAIIGVIAMVFVCSVALSYLFPFC
jgi:hypothetical protein